MNHPLRPEDQRKQSLSLHRAYILVGIVGVVMLIFIVNNYINAGRLNELTSPLWVAVREVKLEAAAVQHEAKDLLRGEIDPSADALWFYLDQSIWHLANLLQAHQQSSRTWLFTGKLDVSDRMETINTHLEQLKNFFKAHQKLAKTPEALTEMIVRCDDLFAAFRFQLEEVEGDISRLMVKEQLQQRISYAVLVVFCVAMFALVAYQIRRYERYRKESYETLNATNIQLATQVEERARAEVALKQSEEKFRGLFESASDLIHILDLDGRILLSNAAAISHLGLSMAELRQRPISDFVNDASRHHFQTLVARVTRDARFNAECTVAGASGQTITADCSAFPVQNSRGRNEFIVIFQKDISSRKQAEQKSRISYEFMKIANDNRQMKPMLSQFTAAIQTHTGCSACAIRLLNDDDPIDDAASDDPSSMGCELDSPMLESNRSMCARVVNNDIDASLAWFTDFGSYFLDRSTQAGDATGTGPQRCAQVRCARLGYRSLALVPIKAGEQILGLIQIADVREGLLNPQLVDLMEMAAMHVGTTIRRLRAEEGLEAAYHELENRVIERTQALSEMNRELETEIEERRQIEDRLRKNRNTLQTVIDGMNDSLVLVDKDMQIRMLNRVAAETYRILSLDNAVGKLCHQVISPVGSCEDCIIPRAVQRREGLTFERQGGADAERLERVTIYPVTEADDASGGAIIRICDITEEKRFEQQLIQSEKMASLGILVSSIGHEINNPNNFITFNIPILREYLEALIRISDQYASTQSDFELFHMDYDEFRQDVFKLVDNIEHGSSRISNFVANLREFSQNNPNREKIWLELPAVVDKVLSICRSQIKKRIRDFRVDIPVSQPSIYADAYSLEQVLLNLIVNAVQAADKLDAAVSVSASTGADWRDTTIITVTDNGCGMDENRLSKIFNPFYTTKPADEGTGLGLYVCHNLVQRLGGRIEVQSRKGEGSTFTIFLPDKDRREKARV